MKHRAGCQMVLLAVLSAAGAPLCAADLSAVIDASRPVNAYAAVDVSTVDSSPTVAIDGQGRAVAVWVPGWCDPLVATSADGGVTWSEPALLKTNLGQDDGFDLSPAVATDGQGTWVAVWASLDTLGGTNDPNYDILSARSVDGGVTWSAPQTISALTSFYTAAPSLATDGQGVWVAAWGGSGVQTARSADGGATWAPPLTIPTGEQPPAAMIATDGNGTWNVVWHSIFGGGIYGFDQDVFVARSTDGGQSWGPKRPVNADAIGPGQNDWKPEIAVDASGTWIVAWERYLGDYDLYFARSTDGGLNWSSPSTLNSNAATDAFGDYDEQVVLRADAGGNWLAAWRSWPDDGATYDIFGARSGDGGATWTTATPLHLETMFGYDAWPQLAADGRGNWLLARQGNWDGPGWEYDIVATRLRLPYQTTCAGDGDADGHGAPGSAACPLGPQTDCDDADPAVAPGAVQSCDGKNNDCDHPSWPALAATIEADDDADGVSECDGDCLDTDPAAWSMPGEVPDLVIERQGAGLAVLHWQPPVDPGGDLATIVYDVLRSEAPFGCGQFGAQTCLESDQAADRSAVDPLLPAAGKVFYYQVRAENGCPGTGRLGLASAGLRLGVSCTGQQATATDITD